ncbi:DUF4262 domain-containing protein [Microbacterium jejuense]|uniref:DUF4262 domain-containing protein n=1 Tax=Microbacterium jejuense TaxID=1263637 RepID=A0ABS7HIV9_9MICO|nr:DUF4262 domain-containing protein [Microbacterium jejuense]MBW9092869.1 DUF4262 domain-containing protein [Microbacterium jejuense]
MTIAPDPSLLAWLDQEDKRTAQTIRAHGTSNEYVFGDMPRRETPFSYTIGLFGLGHPELLVFGLDPRTSGLLLNDVAARVRAGDDLVAGQLLEFAGWGHRVTVEEVPNPGEIVFAANRYYQRPAEASVPVYQLTYDDRGGLFPWDDGYDTAAWIQPRPGTFRA